MDSNDTMEDILQLLENNGTGTFVSPNMIDAQSVTSPASMSSSSASSSPTFTGMAQRSPPHNNTIEGDPYIRIVEQPHPKGLRFRYICEGRSAGSIPGINSTPDNKTYPTIEIVGYTGDVKIIVSCVTADEPYRPHPHNLVGKEGCQYGVCTMRLKGAPMRAVFSNLGIQCVKKKDIRAALEERERIKIDPFKTKFLHKDQPTNIDLNVVRLCFQAFIHTGQRQYYKLRPVVTEPIYDKKSINDLVICRLCSCSAKVNGGDTIFLLCEKLPKDDIKIRFYEEKDNKVIWEDYGEFQQTDIHKQTAIAFKTPRYHNTDIVKKAQVYIQLVRFSNDPSSALQTATFSQVSDPLPFEFYPDPGMRSFPRLQRKLKRRQDMEIFQQIISLDSETTATKYSEISMNDEAENDLDNDTDETATTDSSSSQARSSGTLNERQLRRKFPNASVEDDDDNNRDDNEDDDDDHNEDDEDGNVVRSSGGRKSASMGIEFRVPQMNIDDCTQTSTPMEEILRNTELGAVRQLAAVDKITEWMKSNERTDSMTVETGGSIDTATATTDSDDNDHDHDHDNSNDEDQDVEETRMNNALIEEDIELEDLPDLELLTTSNDYKCVGSSQWYTDFVKPVVGDIPEPVMNFNCSVSAQGSVDVDENFDDTSTYTSLQIAFENPIEIPDLSQQYAAGKEISEKRETEREHNFSLPLNTPTPEIQINAAQPPQTPPSPPLPLPPRTPSPVPEQMLPPLPPKRKPSQELEVIPIKSDASPTQSVADSPPKPVTPIIFTNTVEESPSKRFSSSTLASRAVSQITITNTPEGSPTKRSSTSTPSPKKKQGFFSRFFSRRRSRPDDANPTSTSPNRSRESSISNFSLNDTIRTSIRSVKSLQPNLDEIISKHNPTAPKSGKSVGRSASSVSGKRPYYREGDVIHIPLKGDGSTEVEATYNSLLDQKSLSALQLANVPLTDGNMELVAIADREGIQTLCESNTGICLDPSVNLSEDQFKRKRLRSGGNPMRIIQELQQIDQMHNNSNNNSNSNASTITNSMWNIPLDSSSPSATTVPEIKNEPFLSPNYGGAYRTPYQMSPSPQPSSPMNRNSATPSPGLMKTSSAESQSQMCNAFNQIQVNYSYTPNINVNGATNHNNSNNNPFLDGRSDYTHTNQLHPPTASPSNPFFNPTSGGSITPLYPGADNNVNLSHTSQFQAFNIRNDNNHNTVATASTLNIVDNQFPYQYQYQQNHQQQQPQTQTQPQTQLPEDTSEAAATLNALLQIDSDNFVNINSEELRLSNLSIST